MEKEIEKRCLKDEDFFIDLQVGSEKGIQNLFAANTDKAVAKIGSGKENVGNATSGAPDYGKSLGTRS